MAASCDGVLIILMMSSIMQTIFKEDWVIVREKITKVAFEFSLYAENKTWNVTWRINKCGIHLRYEEDADEFGNLLDDHKDWEALDEEQEDYKTS